MNTEKSFIFHILFDVISVGSWKMHLLFLVHLSLCYNFRNDEQIFVKFDVQNLY